MTKLTPYQELLLDQKWKDKRLEIIERDGWCCKHCNNTRYLNSPDIISGYLGYKTKLGQTKNSKVFIYRCSDSEDNCVQAFATHLPEKLSSEWLYYVKIDKLEEDSKTSNTNHNKLLQLNNMIGKKISPSKIKNRLIAFSSGDKWLYASGLQVHHKYYQDECLPWEYPNEALVTLCPSCHESEHENSIIPHLTKDGINKGELTTCSRCGGAGEFPEFSHIEHGICFLCKGAKYREFINTK